MYRVLLTGISLLIGSLAFAQTTPVRHETSETKSPRPILIMAKCAFPDGTVVGKKLIEVDGGSSAEQKREAAERACDPIMEAASAKCDALANRVDTLRGEYKTVPHNSMRAIELSSQIRQAFAAAPAYCKNGDVREARGEGNVGSSR